MFVIPLRRHSGDLKPNDFTERETDQHYGGQSMMKKVIEVSRHSFATRITIKAVLLISLQEKMHFGFLYLHKSGVNNFS